MRACSRLHHRKREKWEGRGRGERETLSSKRDLDVYTHGGIFISRIFNPPLRTDLLFDLPGEDLRISSRTSSNFTPPPLAPLAVSNRARPPRLVMKERSTAPTLSPAVSSLPTREILRRVNSSWRNFIYGPVRIFPPARRPNPPRDQREALMTAKFLFCSLAQESDLGK